MPGVLKIRGRAPVRLPEGAGSVRRGNGLLELTLPYPPTTNTYWRSWKGRVLVSRAGRAYRAAVAELLRDQEPALNGRLSVIVYIYPPDKRKRDIDNLTKCLLDSLQAAGAIADDGLIDRLVLQRQPPVPGGKVLVQVMCRES